MNPSKLKVVELRAELSSRGLDSKGNKAALVERLEKALEEEAKKGGSPQKAASTPSTPAKGAENENNEAGENDQTVSSQDDDAAKEEESQNAPKSGESAPEGKTEAKKSLEKSSEDKGQGENSEDMVEAEKPVEEAPVEAEKKSESPKKAPTPASTPTKSPVKTPAKTPEKPAEEPMDVDGKNVSEDSQKENETNGNEKENVNHSQKEGYEVKVEQDIKAEPNIKTEPGSVKSEKNNRDDRKRKRSPSPRGGRDQNTPMKPVKEEEPDIKSGAVTLSWYDSDLNLVIDKRTFYEAAPMTEGGFGYIWAGTRGTHGYTKGKLVYQVKVKKYLNVSHLEDEPNPNVLRVGWSLLNTNMQLGEVPFSYGFGGTGKISQNCKFSNYGKPFGEGDVVTAYLEFTDTEFIIFFGVNNETFNEAWRVPIAEVEEKMKAWALAPHVLSKNVKFEVNFGQVEPWSEVKPGYTWLTKVAPEDSIPGPQRPEKRSECEMIMMCGLPACGKTTWANKYVASHPEKHYNILGTNALIDKMKVMGLPRQANYRGRWDILIEKCTKCLQKLMEIGCHRRRNYILDQTNVYPAAQRRKMRNFEGFIRKAVVIVPTDEEFQTRVRAQALEEKKDVPVNAVLEMKANFTLPDKSIFEEIIFTELQEAEAQELIQKYASEASAKGFVKKGPVSGGGGGGGGGPNAKKFRPDFHQNQRHDSFRRGGGPHTPGRGGGDSYRRGPSLGGGGGRGGWSTPRGGGGPDRWRDSRNHGLSGSGGGFRQGGGNDRSGGWRGGGSMGGSAGGRGGRDFDRSGPPRSGSYDRSRGGSGAPGGRPSGGYNRDSRDNQRGKPKPRGGGGPNNLGSSGGSITSAGSNSQGQWGSQYPQQSQSGGQQPWAAAQWNQQQQPQSWGNYAQQWKGFGQQPGGGSGGGFGGAGQQGGYGQQGYGNQGYGNWQQYGGYANAGGGGGGYGQNWQNSDGNSYGGSYPQQQQPSWQGWYAQHAGQTNTSQPPPAK